MGWATVVRVGALPVAEVDGEAVPVGGRVGLGSPDADALPEEEREVCPVTLAMELGEAAGDPLTLGVNVGVEREDGVPPLLKVGLADTVDTPPPPPLGVVRLEPDGVEVGVLRVVRVEVTDTGGTTGAPWEGVDEGEATTVAGVTDTSDRVVRFTREKPVGSRVQSATTAASVLG